MRLVLAVSGVLALCCAGLALATPVAGAAPAGSIDRGFGAGGVGVASTRAVFADGMVARSGRLLVLGNGPNERTLVVRGFTPGGAVLPRVKSTVELAGPGQGGEGVDAIAEDAASGRIVVLTTTYVKSDLRTTLLVLDPDGKLDPSFGHGGRLALPGEPDGGGVAVAPDGSILAAVNVQTAPSGEDVVYYRVSPDGRLLSRASVVDPSTDTVVPVALHDGSALVAIQDGQGGAGTELVRFDAAGRRDFGFGRGGVVRLGGSIAVDAGTTDGPDHVLLAGAHLRSYSRSDLTNASPLLIRVSDQGQVDRGFGRVGRGIGEAFDFSAVAVDGDRILAAAPSGAVASLSAATGDAEPGFGVGGLSPVPPARFGEGGPLALDGSLAVVAGTPDSAGRASGLTLVGVRLTGSGVLPPRPGQSVTVRRVAGKAGIKVPLATVEQPLSAPVAAPLMIGIVNHGEDGIYIPPATILDARHGTIAIDGSGGRAVVRGGTVSLRRRHGAVATIVAARQGCQATTLRLSGRFAIGIGTGGSRFVTVTPRSRLRVRPCDSHRPLKVLSGRVRPAHHGPRLPN